MSEDATNPNEEIVNDNNDNVEAEPTTLQEQETEEVSIEALNEQIASLQKEVTDTKARANADMYNFQKRVERETDMAKKFVLEKFSKDLLENIDNLERAIDAAKTSGVDEEDALLQGVSLTHKSIMKTLEKHKITVITPEVGEDFNADLHEAVGMDPEAETGKVGKLLQKGYLMQDRLLRPAMVMVGQ